MAWIHRHLIKDKCSWTVKKTSDCTWGWRTLLKLREDARLFLKCEVGDGRKIFLWHDHWHLDGILYLKYGHRVVYDAASRSDARAGQIKSEDQLLNIIKRDVKNRLHSKNGFRDNILNRILCCNWGISVAGVVRRDVAV